MLLTEDGIPCGKVECSLKCPNCDKEILDEDATFCPKCGNPLEAQSISSDLVLGAAILAMIAAAFTGGMGYIAIYQYIQLVSFYDFSLVFGFLILGVVGIIGSAFAISGAAFMLKRKIIIFSILGAVFPSVSAFVTYITVERFEYGFTDILLFSQISLIILSILSAILVFKSRDEFA